MSRGDNYLDTRRQLMTCFTVAHGSQSSWAVTKQVQQHC